MLKTEGSVERGEGIGEKRALVKAKPIIAFVAPKISLFYFNSIKY